MTDVKAPRLLKSHRPLDIADFQDWLRVVEDAVSFLWDAVHCICPWSNAMFGPSHIFNEKPGEPHSCFALPTNLDGEWFEFRLFLRD